MPKKIPEPAPSQKTVEADAEPNLELPPESPYSRRAEEAEERCVDDLEAGLYPELFDPDDYSEPDTPKVSKQ